MAIAFGLADCLSIARIWETAFSSMIPQVTVRLGKVMRVLFVSIY